MKFYEALKEVLENGRLIRRPHWAKPYSMGRGTPCLHYYMNGVMQGRSSDTLLNNHDLIAQDWEIVAKPKIKKSRTVWINCYKEMTSDGMIHATLESASVCKKNSDFLFTKEVTFEWEEES
jgi:hypothetical protein